MQRTRHAVHEVHYSKGNSLPSSTTNVRKNKVKFSNTTINFSNPTSDGGLRQTMKKQAEESLKDSRSASQSKKFEYSSKLKEKKNYVYYVSGVGYVTKEEEEKPKPIIKKEEETYIQRKHIIDNYQYHETKNIKNEKKKSNVFHRRLAQPFEVTEQIKTKKKNPYIEINDDNNFYEPLRGRNFQPKKYNVTVPNKRVNSNINSYLRNLPKQNFTEEFYEMREGKEQIYDDFPANDYYYYQQRNNNGQKQNFGFFDNNKSNVVKSKRQTTVIHRRGNKSYESKRGNGSFSGTSGNRKQVVTTTTSIKRKGYVAKPYQSSYGRK